MTNDDYGARICKNSHNYLYIYDYNFGNYGNRSYEIHLIKYDDKRKTSTNYEKIIITIIITCNENGDVWSVS